jgi:hypothetical protein
VTLTFCEYSPGWDRRPVAIDPMRVVTLTPGTREVARGKFIDCIKVLTVTLADGSEVVLFDTAGAVAKRIIRERAVEMGRATAAAPSPPCPPAGR